MELWFLLFGLVLLNFSLLARSSDSKTILGLFKNPADEDSEEVRVDSKPRYCDTYHKESSNSDTPCSKEELDENGICNKTQKCNNKGAERSYCFMTWRNESGKVQVISSGCWLNPDACTAKKECRAFNNTDNKGVYFCCCEGNFCNRHFYLDPAFDTDESYTVTEEETGPYNQWMILVYVLVPLFILCVVVILSFWLYRRRKRPYDDMDGVSVATPATGTTHCTMSSFSPISENSPPTLIDMKARGRFGKVWRAQLQDSFVAVKTFELHQKMSWQNEQDIFMTPLMCSHDNILKFMSAAKRGEGNATEFWLITEFYERGSLSDYLKSNTVDLAEALRIMESMACGMSFLHEDIQARSGDYKPAIAHRDFKSKNVLLDQNLNAIIADFGLAVKFTPGESPGESHGQVGTLRYMAPEVLEGAINFQKDAFLRIDMYAFGLVIWEILSRCTIIDDVGEAQLPFEPELGTHPTMDDMQEHVVEKKLRPHIRDEWKAIKQVLTVCETMEECWDHDAEARLSAGCVELRVKSLRNQQARIDPITNEIHSIPLIIALPPSSHDQNTEAMNQLNLQFSNMNTSNNPHFQANTADKNVNQQLSNGQIGHMTSSLNDPAPDQSKQGKKTQQETTLRYDDDQDSGTFANEDTLSQDGVMEQLLNTDSDSSAVPTVRVIDSEHDSATSLLMPDERESDL